jgi:hypothetical protein
MFARVRNLVLVLAAAASAAFAQELRAPESMRGEVVVRRNDANNLAVIVDRDRDGIADVIFVLGADETFADAAFHTFDDATLQIAQQRIVIRDGGRAAVTLALQGQCVPREGDHYEGFGLNYHPNPQLPPMAALRSSRAPLAADPACHDCAVYDAVDPHGD